MKGEDVIVVLTLKPGSAATVAVFAHYGDAETYVREECKRALLAGRSRPLTTISTQAVR